MGKLGCIVDADAEDNTGVTGAGAAPAAPNSPSAQIAATVPGAPVLLAGAEKTNFGDFYAGHYSDLVRLATLLSGSADAAPDLVQDCFVRLHGHWTAVHDPLPYVRRSVVHACASHHRSMARGRRLPTPEAQDSQLGADELEDALAKLPARQRAAVVLRYYGDLPDADIARALRCRPGTVRSLIHRALADLRKVIEP
jgi:RNA polymerase sigma-70 factor (sigma-E family)